MEFQSGNVFIRKNLLPKAGDVTRGHRHNFDHTTILFKGAVRISATLPDGTKIEREAEAPYHFLIRAHVEHEIVALADDTEYWCVYSHRNAQGEVVLEYSGFGEAYA